MLLYSTKKDSKRYAASTVVETENWHPGGGSGVSVDHRNDTAAVTILLSRGEGYKGRSYTLRMAEDEVIRLRDLLNEKLDSIARMRKERTNG